MTPMTPEESAAVDQLATEFPAAPELVLSALKATYDARLYPSTSVAEVRRRRALDALPAIARRLLTAETELANTRAVVARIAHAAGEGDDYALSDLVWELERAGVGIERELADVDAVRTAEYEAQARR
jgi:hypothetical protein